MSVCREIRLNMLLNKCYTRIYPPKLDLHHIHLVLYMEQYQYVCSSHYPTVTSTYPWTPRTPSQMSHYRITGLRRGYVSGKLLGWAAVFTQQPLLCSIHKSHIPGTRYLYRKPIHFRPRLFTTYGLQYLSAVHTLL